MRSVFKALWWCVKTFIVETVSTIVALGTILLVFILAQEKYLGKWMWILILAGCVAATVGLLSFVVVRARKPRSSQPDSSKDSL